MNTFRDRIRDKARQEIERRLDINRLVDEEVAKAGTPDFNNTITEVKDRLKTNPPENWSELLDDLLTA